MQNSFHLRAGGNTNMTSINAMSPPRVDGHSSKKQTPKSILKSPERSQREAGQPLSMSDPTFVMLMSHGSRGGNPGQVNI